MPSQINASNSGFGGIVSTGDSSGVLQLQTTGTTALTIDTSQNVGIGTTSPNKLLHTYRNNTDQTAQVQVEQAGSGSPTLGFLKTGVYAWLTGLYNSDNSYRIAASGADLNTNTRLTIDSSGNVGIGTTSPSSYAPLSVAATTTNANVGKICSVGLTAGDVGSAGMSVIKYDNNTTTSQIFFKFIINQSANGSGQINANGANACAFGTYSDARIKENIEPLSSQLDNILALKPSEFDYIESEGGGHQIGFIAQEMQEVYPDAVGERSDGMLTISGWDKTTARLVKAIQEQQTIINDLKARIETLETK